MDWEFCFARIRYWGCHGRSCHDARDHEFATKYNLDIKQVIETDNNDFPILQKGKLINSENFNGMQSDSASNEIVNELTKLKLGEELIQFRLRDWGVSRQRYWGCPIPVIYDGDVPSVLGENDIPIELPELEENEPQPAKSNEKFLKLKRVLEEKQILILLWILHGITQDSHLLTMKMRYLMKKPNTGSQWIFILVELNTLYYISYIQDFFIKL